MKQFTRLLAICCLIAASTSLFACSPAYTLTSDPGAIEDSAEKILKKNDNLVVTSWETIPTFEMQFQLSGYETQAASFEDENSLSQIEFSIDSSLTMVNEIFSPAVQFGRDPMIWYFDPGGYSLYDIREMILGNNKERQKYKEWLAERVSDSTMTVFVMPTYETDRGTLLGFTPVLANQLHYYAEDSPDYDVIFISYQGLRKGTTLAHECGHWLALPHVFDLPDDEQERLKLAEVWEHNVMNYGKLLTDIDISQLELAALSATTNRSYLSYVESDGEIYIPPFKQREGRDIQSSIQEYLEEAVKIRK